MKWMRKKLWSWDWKRLLLFELRLQTGAESVAVDAAAAAAAAAAAPLRDHPSLGVGCTGRDFQAGRHRYSLAHTCTRSGGRSRRVRGGGSWHCVRWRERVFMCVCEKEREREWKRFCYRMKKNELSSPSSGLRIIIWDRNNPGRIFFFSSETHQLSGSKRQQVGPSRSCTYAAERTKPSSFVISWLRSYLRNKLFWHPEKNHFFTSMKFLKPISFRNLRFEAQHHRIVPN